MKTINLEEINCDESEWDEITSQLNNGWQSLENNIRFAFKTKSKSICENDIETLFWDKYPYIDSIEVEQFKIENPEKSMRYFGVSIIIYESGIL